jgi:hypothetical protein
MAGELGAVLLGLDLAEAEAEAELKGGEVFGPDLASALARVGSLLTEPGEGRTLGLATE